MWLLDNAENRKKIAIVYKFAILDYSTSKSLSEAIILGSTNPQYVKRLFIDLPVKYMKTTSSEHGKNILCA